jgi:hypothetical protein
MGYLSARHIDLMRIPESNKDVPVSDGDIPVIP